MAQRKRPGKSPQARHGKKSTPSRHDKRDRLARANPQRRRTEAASVPLIGVIASLAAGMGRLLDVRIAFRLPIILAGALLAGGRRTAASWFRAAGVGDDWDRFYECLQSVGKNATSLMLPLVMFIVNRFDPGAGGYWKIAIDDSPTKRFGRCVEAANVHHNPTPGPADGPWLYGHNWVCLALLLRHSLFGLIALPLLSRLYVRQVEVPKLPKQYNWEFRTKHQLALELLGQVMGLLKALGSKAGFLVVFDGAYAASKLIRSLLALGAVVVTRLRCDAKLFDLPVKEPGRRGRPRIYGRNRISLAKRAGHREGWQTVRYTSRGVLIEGRCKTFLATSQLAGGVVRIVLLEHASGNWAAYLSTDAEMSVQTILETVADRWAIEEHFHDVKEIWGAGEQQVRNLWSNIGCWNLCCWLYTLVELACWDEPAEDLVDRSDRPWDNPLRRPSHADRRRRIAREMLRQEFLNDLPTNAEQPKIRDRIERLLSLAL
ncbi:MAG: transposase [Nitrospirota bacterium]